MIKIGHRGASGYEPENTIVAFKKAVQQGVDYIELDVHLSKDKQVIVMHDETLDRTTNCKGRISEKTLDEIKECRIIKKGQAVPTLQDVINEVKGKVKINIEIKGVEPAKRVSDIIKENQIADDVMVSSNHVRSLIIIKESVPKASTALLYYATKEVWTIYPLVFFSFLVFPFIKWLIIKRAKLANVGYINLVYPLATKDFVAKLHKLGLKVNIWVVNKEEQIKKYRELGVDGMISDFPDKL